MIQGAVDSSFSFVPFCKSNIQFFSKLVSRVRRVSSTTCVRLSSVRRRIIAPGGGNKRRDRRPARDAPAGKALQEGRARVAFSASALRPHCNRRRTFCQEVFI